MEKAGICRKDDEMGREFYSVRQIPKGFVLVAVGCMRAIVRAVIRYIMAAHARRFVKLFLVSFFAAGLVRGIGSWIANERN